MEWNGQHGLQSARNESEETDGTGTCCSGARMIAEEFETTAIQYVHAPPKNLKSILITVRFCHQHLHIQSSPQSPAQLPPCLVAHVGHIRVGDDAVSLVDLALDLVKVSPDPLCSPLIAIAYPPTTPDQPLSTFPALVIEGREDGVEIGVRVNSFVRQQGREHGGIFDAETCSGAVVGRSGVCGVPGYANAASVECRDGVLTQVEDCPLFRPRQYLVLFFSGAISSMWATYDVQVRLRQVQQLGHIGSIPLKIPQSVFSLRRPRQPLRVRPVVGRRSERHNVQRLAVVDGEGQHMAIGAHLDRDWSAMRCRFPYTPD